MVFDQGPQSIEYLPQAAGELVPAYGDTTMSHMNTV
jgi:hypothetical protein